MRIAYLEPTSAGGEGIEPTSAGGEGIETTPAPSHREQEQLPAATMRLVPYATDEVEWQQVDEYPLAY